MIQIRKSAERGHADHGWLNSHHTFSFAGYRDPKNMGFRQLRVINEDRVQAGQGFGKHSHSDMEIISYVLSGELAHQDSLGTGSVIRPGDVQRMSAGTGVEHSEFNQSKTSPVHFLQIWIVPSQAGFPPSYEEKKFSDSEKKNQLRLIVSPTGEDGSLGIHQDVRLFASLLDAGKAVSYELARERHAWVQVLRGDVTLNGSALGTGDGAAISAESALKIEATRDAEILLFDLN